MTWYWRIFIQCHFIAQLISFVKFDSSVSQIINLVAGFKYSDEANYRLLSRICLALLLAFWILDCFPLSGNFLSQDNRVVLNGNACVRDMFLLVTNCLLLLYAFGPVMLLLRQRKQEGQRTTELGGVQTVRGARSSTESTTFTPVSLLVTHDQDWPC